MSDEQHRQGRPGAVRYRRDLVGGVLGHLLQAIERIDSYIAGLDQAAFIHNPMVQDAVIRNLEIIGEASHNIEVNFPEFAASHQELPLAFAYQMRNAVAHGYFKVDLEVVWKTIENDLPKLAAQVSAIRSTLRDKLSPP